MSYSRDGNRSAISLQEDEEVGSDCSTYLVRELSGHGESLLLLAGEGSRHSVESALRVELDSLGEALELGRDGRHCELSGEVV